MDSSSETALSDIFYATTAVAFYRVQKTGVKLCQLASTTTETTSVHIVSVLEEYYVLLCRLTRARPADVIEIKT